MGALLSAGQRIQYLYYSQRFVFFLRVLHSHIMLLIVHAKHEYFVKLFVTFCDMFLAYCTFYFQVGCATRI